MYEEGDTQNTKDTHTNHQLQNTDNAQITIYSGD